MRNAIPGGFLYRFTVLTPRSEGLLRSLLKLALAETEVVFGKTKVKLETAYDFSAKGPVCTVEGGTDCGEHLAKLLTGFLIKKFGEDGFQVERLSRRGQG